MRRVGQTRLSMPRIPTHTATLGIPTVAGSTTPAWQQFYTKIKYENEIDSIFAISFLFRTTCFQRGFLFFLRKNELMLKNQERSGLLARKSRFGITFQSDFKTKCSKLGTNRHVQNSRAGISSDFVDLILISSCLCSCKTPVPGVGGTRTAEIRRHGNS